jgi:hypothetical protein
VLTTGGATAKLHTQYAKYTLKFINMEMCKTAKHSMLKLTEHQTPRSMLHKTSYLKTDTDGQHAVFKEDPTKTAYNIPATVIPLANAITHPIRPVCQHSANNNSLEN